MNDQFKYLLTACMYFTRIPGIRNAPWDEKAQREALKFFPLIGWIVGAFGALVLYLAQLFLPLAIAVVIAVIAMLFITGAMHEDGLADSVDAFGGAFEREKVLQIMKDSRLGVYGGIALVAVLGLKSLLIFELAFFDLGHGMLALMFTQAASRWAVLAIPAELDYAQTSPDSKSQPMVGERMPWHAVGISALFVLIPMLIFGDSSWWIAILVATAASFAMGRYFKARIGG
ncbi:MAG: adenosylcobinamide-GDP ribazoletransferase, partial [Pseudomonadota bacterium]